MIIYVPLEITGEGVAGGLPEETVIFRRNGSGETITGSKVGVNAWETLDRTEKGWDYLDRDVVGWTALIPINLGSNFRSVEEVRERLHARRTS